MMWQRQQNKVSQCPKYGNQKENMQVEVNVPLVQSIHHHPRPSDKMEKRTSLRRPSEGWETIKKTVVPGRKSDYFLQKGMKGKTENMYRFSEHADRIRSTDPSLNTSHEGSSLITQPHSPPLTFGIVRESVSNILSPMLKDKKHILEHKKSASLLPKLSHQSTCFNHPAQQAKYYLLLAEPEHPTATTHKHLLYCEECGVNIQQQGFTIHNLLGQQKSSSPFMSNLQACIKQIEQNMDTLNKYPYLKLIRTRAEEVQKKYDSVMEMVLECKKVELITLERYKFQVFEYITTKQKQLECTLKKLQLLHESYSKNCPNSELQQPELYWSILNAEHEQLTNINILKQLEGIKINETKFLDEVEICEKLMSISKERVYELSFEESQELPPQKPLEEAKIMLVESNILDGLNATFGQQQSI